MPKQYEAVRDALVKKGMPVKDAKTLAAKTYNEHRGSKPPVTGKDKE